MIKDFILAIVLGAILGLGITGAFYAIHKNNNSSNQTNISPTPTISQSSDQISTTPTTTQTKTSSINIISPENNAVLSTSKINIKGDAKPNSLIVISTPSKTFNDKANANGIFNISIELDSGFNLIKISSIDSDENQDQTELNLTYSTAKI